MFLFVRLLKPVSSFKLNRVQFCTAIGSELASRGVSVDGTCFQRHVCETLIQLMSCIDLLDVTLGTLFDIFDNGKLACVI